MRNQKAAKTAMLTNPVNINRSQRPGWKLIATHVPACVLFRIQTARRGP